MKFYKVVHHNLVRAESYVTVDEREDGDYATRDDAEQAAKDAVEMAKLAVKERMTRLLNDTSLSNEVILKDEKVLQAQAVIERYEGGQG